MIIVGYKNIPKLLGSVDTFECQRCLNIANWNLLNVEKYFTLFFIPIIPTGDEYSIICESCHHQEILNKKDFTNYKIKSEIEIAFLENRITQDERERQINEIDKIIEQDKEQRRNKALEGSKEWIDLASKKSDEELLTIYFQERYKYNPSMIIAVKSEIEKRKLEEEYER
jgi:hypothetical protein